MLRPPSCPAGRSHRRLISDGKPRCVAIGAVCVLTVCLVQCATAHAGVVSYVGGSTYISYDNGGGAGLVSQNVLPAVPTLQLDTTIDNYYYQGLTATLKAGGYELGSSTSAEINYDSRTYVSLAGGPPPAGISPTAGVDAQFGGIWNYFSPAWLDDLIHGGKEYLEVGLNVDVHGVVAPGDSVLVGAYAAGNNAQLFDFTGVPGNHFVSASGDFSFSVHLASGPIDITGSVTEGFGHLTLDLLTYLDLYIQRTGGSGGTSWLALGDPGVTVQQVDANGNPIASPAPSTLAMGSILFGMLGLVWSYNRMKRNDAR